MSGEKYHRLLRIRTTGRDDSHSDQYHYPYEPTPYPVLERLADSGYIRKENTLLDYGCGKGRVDFYLAWQTRCCAIGVEYDRRIFEKAEENQKTAVSVGRTLFELASAELFPVPERADRFYFFNPFSAEILQKVLARILESWYEAPREMLLFEYYGAAEPPVRCGVSHLSGLTEPRLIVTQLEQDPDHRPLSWKGLSMDRCSQC